MPQIVTSLHTAVRSDLLAGTDRATAQLYENLPTVDFSRDILAGEEPHLSVLSVPPCGWSDLGTPKRVAQVLYKVPRPTALSRWDGALGYLSLAAQHELLPTTAAHCRSA
jgi:hypothetical protein